MNGQKIMIRILVSLFKVFSCIVIFSLVGMLSYKITWHYYQDAKPHISASEVSVMNTVAEARVDPVAVNAVFSVDEASAEITHIILEIFNTETKNIDLITIPVALHMEMSSELYEELREVNENIPQIIKLSNLGEYFKQDIVYEYGILLLEELLDTDISFYTTIKDSTFNQYFEQSTENEQVYQLKEETIKQLDEIVTSSEFEQVLGEYYKNIQSNLTEQQRSQYIKYYLNANYEYVYSYVLDGQWEDGEFVVADSNKEKVNTIVQNEEVYRISQGSINEDLQENNGSEVGTEVGTEVEETTLSSKGYRIQILNGSMVTGLGATYKELLTSEGYSVLSVGNYTDEVLDTTKIYVVKEGLGKDLEAYFQEPIIETASVPGDYDIVIVLGRNDAK